MATTKKTEATKAEGGPAHDVWRGHVLVPAVGGGWLTREVALPSTVVTTYQVEKQPRPFDLRAGIVARIVDWLTNPELIRKWK